MTHEVITLPYSLDSLEPYIDKETMKLHFKMHYKSYTDKMNAVLDKYPDLSNRKVEELLKDLKNLKMEKDDMNTFKNNAGGFVNHSLYFSIMGPKKKIDEALVQRVKDQFGSVDSFKEKLSDTAMSVFGSGWAWLVEDSNQMLKIHKTANQDSPYLENLTPIIGLDVWEHSYYLKYNNRRGEYVHNWWNVLKLI